MKRPARNDPPPARDNAALVARCLEHILDHGVSDTSLRPLAKATGTSARMLVYHFGSRAGVLTAVMDELRERLQASFAAMRPRPSSGRYPLETFWRWASAPERLRYIRLLFEVQVLALQRPKEFAPYLERVSSTWLAVVERELPPSPRRTAIATLCLAVVDGLVLELLSTGDRRRTTEALGVFHQLLEGAGAKR